MKFDYSVIGMPFLMVVDKMFESGIDCCIKNLIIVDIANISKTS